MKRANQGRSCVVLLAVVLVLMVTPRIGSAQEPDNTPKNLQFFPEDITRDSLVSIMRGFSFALGVRCQYCHVGGDGVSFDGVEFESDDDPDKVKARFMLRMVETINQSMLPMMVGRDEPASKLTCKSCHRGSPKPVLLTDMLRATLEAQGADSAVAQYRSLREESLVDGMYDFGEWEMNVFAERLAGEGRSQDAIAMFKLNHEFYPRSGSIVMSLAGLHERIEDTASAIRYYEQALELAPNNRRATARLQALKGGG